MLYYVTLVIFHCITKKIFYFILSANALNSRGTNVLLPFIYTHITTIINLVYVVPQAKPQYSFAYGVENPNTGDSHGHSETRDGSHVTGEYSVMEPDGVLRRVLYTSDPKNGFRASVRYVRPDGEESSNRDHGYHSAPERLPGPPPQQQQHSEYESDGGGGGGDDDEPRPFALQPQSQSLSSEYESDVDGESFAPQLPRPQPLSLNFGFNKYNDVNDINNNVEDDDGDNNVENNGDNNGDYEGGRPSGFKFPSPSSPFFKAADAVNGASTKTDPILVD